MVKPGDGGFGNPVGAIPPAREPHRIEGRIVGAFDKGGKAHVVRPGEVPVHRKALRVDVQFDIGELCPRQRGNTLCILLQERGGRGADGDADHGNLV